jgi:hypothetical protein
MKELTFYQTQSEIQEALSRTLLPGLQMPKILFFPFFQDKIPIPPWSFMSIHNSTGFLFFLLWLKGIAETRICQVGLLWAHSGDFQLRPGFKHYPVSFFGVIGYSQFAELLGWEKIKPLVEITLPNFEMWNANHYSSKPRLMAVIPSNCTLKITRIEFFSP